MQKYKTCLVAWTASLARLSGATHTHLARLAGNGGSYCFCLARLRLALHALDSPSERHPPPPPRPSPCPAPPPRPSLCPAPLPHRPLVWHRLLIARVQPWVHAAPSSCSRSAPSSQRARRTQRGAAVASFVVR